MESRTDHQCIAKSTIGEKSIKGEVEFQYVIYMYNAYVYYTTPVHDVEMKLTSIDFSRLVAKGCTVEAHLIQILDNQLIDRSPYQ